LLAVPYPSILEMTGGSYLVPLRIEVVVTLEPSPTVEALVEEEDTYLVLSADPEVREPGIARLRAFHEAYAAEPATPGSIVVREGSPIRLLAVIHDLSQDPTWREEWVAAALEAALVEADSREVRTLAMPPLGRVHGSLPRERFVVLLRSALGTASSRHLEDIQLVVPGEEVNAFRDLFESGLWR
jgi:hypothetical protein